MTYACPDPGCGWSPRFDVDDDDDWQTVLAVHRIVVWEIELDAQLDD